MDTALVIVLIVAALVVLAVVFMASQRASVRKREHARAQAGEHRSDAKLHQTRAERESAAADEQAARARREAAEAEERAQRARTEGERAQELHQRAQEVDPDVDTTSNGDVADQRAPDTETRA